MRHLFAFMITLLLAGGVLSQTKIRSVQISSVGQTGANEASGKAMISNGSGAVVWQFPDWVNLANKPDMENYPLKAGTETISGAWNFSNNLTTSSLTLNQSAFTNSILSGDANGNISHKTLAQLGIQPVGNYAPLLYATDGNLAKQKGIYSFGFQPINMPVDIHNWWNSITLSVGSDSYVTQILSTVNADRMWFRRTLNNGATWSTNEFWHSGNLPSPIQGTGTSGYLPVWNSDTKSLGNSVVSQNGLGGILVSSDAPTISLYDANGTTNTRRTYQGVDGVMGAYYHNIANDAGAYLKAGYYLFLNTGNFVVGNNVDNGTDKMQVNGCIKATTATFSTVGTTAATSVLGRDVNGLLTTNLGIGTNYLAYWNGSTLASSYFRSTVGTNNRAAVWATYLPTPDFGTAMYMTNDIGSTQGAIRMRSTYNGAGTTAKPNFAIDRSTTSQAYGEDPTSLTYTNSLTIDGNTGNTGIGYWTGTELANNKLAVNGSGYFNGAIQATTADLTNGNIQNSGVNFLRTTGTATILSANPGTIYLRPNGDASTTTQATYDTGGNLTVSGTVQATTGKFTNLTDAAIPYRKSSTEGLVDSPLKVYVTNALVQGATSVYTSSGGYSKMNNYSNNGVYAGYSAGEFFNSTDGVVNYNVKSRGATIGSHAVVLNGDNVQANLFEASDGASFKRGAVSRVLVDGTPATNVVPMAFTWETMGSAGNLTERMRLSSAGYLGLGTTNPVGKLQIVGTSSDRVILSNSTADTNADSPKLSFYGLGTNDRIVGPSIQKIGNYSYGAGRLAFLQHNAGDYTNEYEAMSIMPGGNVDVGYSGTRSEKFAVNGNSYVNGNSTTSGDISIVHSPAVWDHFRISHSGGQSLIDAGGAESGMVFRVDVTSSSYPAPSYTEVLKLLPASATVTGGLTITRSGNGVELLKFNTERAWNFTQNGTGASTELRLNDLTGSKTFKITDVISGGSISIFNGNMTATGNMNAYNFVLTSDKRVKTHIKPLDYGNIDKVKWVQFEMKNDTLHRKRAGVIAQDLEKIFPEFVHTAKDSMQTKSVNYNDLLVVAVAKLQADMKETKEELKKANDKIAKLEKQVRRIKRKRNEK